LCALPGETAKRHCMIEMFHKGGPLMYPLLIGSVLMIAVAVERAFHFVGTKVNSRLIASVGRLVQAKEFDGALGEIRSSGDPVSLIIGEVIRLRERPREAIENDVSLKGEQILEKLGKNLHLLGLIGRISPMLGLLGTVTGMVKAFQMVAGSRSLVEPAMLANGIWEALLTTVAGLFIAIPALVFQHFYEERLKAIAFDMKHYGEEFISLLGERR